LKVPPTPSVCSQFRVLERDVGATDMGKSIAANPAWIIRIGAMQRLAVVLIASVI